MTQAKIEKTTNPDDLEEVDVRPRKNRGAVISVRLTPDEAQRLAKMASRTGLSVSELARRSLRDTIYTPWRLVGFGFPSAPAVLVGIATFSGGEFGQQSRQDPVTEQWPTYWRELVSG